MALNTTQLQIKDAALNTKNVKQLIDASGNILPLSALQDTDGNLIDLNNGLPIKFANDSTNDYQFAMKIVPVTTLAAGTVYAAIRNSGTKTIYIDYLNITQVFAGTAAASTSDYELVLFSGGTAVPVGTSPNIGKRKGTNTVPDIEVKFQNTGGITVTGATIATNGLIIGHINQLSANNNYRLELQGKPMILAPEEGVIFRALSTIVAGSTNYITCLFREI